VLNQANTRQASPTRNDAIPCFVWWWFEPDLWPGKNDGSDFAGSAQYTIAIAIRTTPRMIAAAARRRLLLTRKTARGPLACGRLRGVRELAEFARDQVGRLLADVDRAVADP